jgi:hypothetical protein
VIAWFRRVYDPWWTFGYWLVLMTPIAGIYTILTMLGEVFPSGEARRFLLVFPSIGLLGYGVWRGFVFQPLFRPDYRRWLESTPWTPARPLPFGPLHLVGQDLVVAVAFHAPAAIVNGFDASIVLALGGLGYLIGSLCAFGYAGPRGHLYAVLALVAVGVYMGTYYFGLALPVLVAAYVVTVHGQRRNLDRFPWPEQFPALETNMQLGWPYQQMDTRRKPEPIDMWERPVIGLLVGMVLFVALWISWISQNPLLVQHGYIQARDFASGCLVPLFGVLLIARLIWMVFCAPPISLMGRLAIGRPLIPGYDILFLAPLLAFLLFFPLSMVLIENGLHPIMAYPVCAFLGTTAYLLCPPRYAEWRLTAPCRLTIYSVKDATAAAATRRPGSPMPLGVRTS